MSDLTATQALQMAIQDLQARYISAIDNDLLEAWPDFFTDDCHYRITPKADYDDGLPLGIIYASSKAMLIDRVTSLRKANIYEDQGYRHMIGPSLILARDGALVSAETNFMVVRTRHDGDAVLFATGRYLDRIQVQGAAALFREKVAVIDSAKIDTLLAIPL